MLKISRISTSRYSTAIFLLFLSATMVAQESSGSLMDMSLEELLNMEVTTVAGRAQSISDVPATIYIITEEMISNRGYMNIEELLEDIPEVEIQKKSAPEYNNHISFRGITGNEKFLVLLDGFRLSSATGTPHAIASNYSLANAERVEVMLGPASVLYQHAFSGIVNIITKSGDQINGIEAGASLGNYQSTDNSIMIGKKYGNVSIALTGQFYRSDEPNFSELYPADFSFFHNEYQQDGKGRLSPLFPDILVDAPILPYETPTRSYFTSARINVNSFEAGYSRAMESHSSGYGAQPDYYLYARENIYAIVNELFYLEHRFASSDGKLTLSTSASKNDFELLPQSKFVNAFTGYQDGYKYGTEKNFKAEEQISYSFSQDHYITGGIYYEDVSALPKTGDLPFEYETGVSEEIQGHYYLGTNIIDSEGNDLTVEQSFFHLAYQNYGGYMQLQSRPLQPVEFTVGARIDHNTNFGTHPNVRAGFVATPVEKVKFKLLYGLAFLPVSPYQSHQHYGAFIPTTGVSGDTTGLVGPFWHLPNPDLQPEKLSSFESNLFFYPNKNVIIGLDGYYSEVSDLIVFGGVADSSFQGIPVDFAELAVNQGVSTVYGGTAQIELRLNQNDFGLNTRVAYSFSGGDISGNILTYSAKHTLRASVEFTYTNIVISPRFLYRGSSYHPNIVDENGEPAGNDPFGILNLFARYDNLINTNQFNLSAFVKMQNVTDQRHYNVAFSGPEGFMTPQDPFRILGGISIKI